MILKAKIVFQPVRRAHVVEGDLLYRTSGLVKIVEIKANVIRYKFLGDDTIIDSNKFEGFYQPIGYVVSRNWDNDNRWLRIQPSSFHFITMPKKIIGLSDVKEIRRMSLDEDERLYIPPHAIKL